MKVSQCRCIVDSNILIDFNVCGLIKCLFELPFKFISTDFLIDERKSIDPNFLLALGLSKEEMSGEQVLYVEKLTIQHPDISPEDLFALGLSYFTNSILLSGDRKLIAIAKFHNIKSHGTLWVLDEMVNIQIITPNLAIFSLQDMRTKNRRLPLKECKEFIKRWKRLCK